MIVMGRNEIRQFDMVTFDYRQMIGGLHSASAVDFALNSKILIWADDADRAIFRSKNDSIKISVGMHS